MLSLAAKRAGLAHLGLTPYDFRHSRTTIGANSGAPLTGIAYIVGHKHVSTTALYIHSGEEAARAALAAMAKAKKSGALWGRYLDRYKMKKRQLRRFPASFCGQCEGRDLNPHGVTR